MNQTLKVLLVEDNPDDALLVLRELKNQGFAATAQRVDSEAEFLRHLKDDIDLILADYNLPGFGAMRALELANESGLKIAFIIVSGRIGEDIAVEAIRRGASDYVLKDRLGRLGPAVLLALRAAEERKQRGILEKQIIEAQKMEVVGHLAGGVAHDFNNVLGVILGYSDMMLAKLPAGSEFRTYVEAIRSSADRAGALTRQLLIFSRKQQVQLAVLDINGVLQEMDKMLRRLIDEDIEMTILPAPQLGRVKADSGYVGQILMNLVINARDAMPDGGKLTITTENVTLDKNSPDVPQDASPGNYVVLNVADTGIGMTPEVKARMFEAFFTTKPKGKGTGLGLTTCHTIMQQSGGFIVAESEPGRGTKFRVYFPRVDEVPVEVETKAMPSGALPRGTETLLVVEDEPPLRKMACHLLQNQGYSVLSAINGHEALNSVREHKGEPISLVVTDIIMPRMSGKVMAEWLKASNPDLKILFTSGYSEEAIEFQGALEKGVDFLPKPYTSATLACKVREMLDEPVND